MVTKFIEVVNTVARGLGHGCALSAEGLEDLPYGARLDQLNRAWAEKAWADQSSIPPVAGWSLRHLTGGAMELSHRSPRGRIEVKAQKAALVGLVHIELWAGPAETPRMVLKVSMIFNPREELHELWVGQYDPELVEGRLDRLASIVAIDDATEGWLSRLLVEAGPDGELLYGALAAYRSADQPIVRPGRWGRQRV